MPPRPAAPAAPLNLISAVRREFSGSAADLADPRERADVSRYLTDLTQPSSSGGSSPRAGTAGGSGGSSPRASTAAESGAFERGQSYGEMAEPLVRALVPAGETADLLLLAFSVHDLRPGRATAAYLSSVCPGTPLSYAICDQGSAAPFTGLRIIRSYLGTPGYRRALLIVVEQAELSYRTTGPMPRRHRAVAMLLEDVVPPGAPHARITGLVQHAAVPAEAVPDLAAAALAQLSAEHSGERLALLSERAARLCPDLAVMRARAAAGGQPSTDVWWELAGLLADPATAPDLVVIADYEASLHYVCLAALQCCSGGMTSRNPRSPQQLSP